MLNVTSFNIGEITSKVSLNTPSSGIIQRSHPRSKFVRFHSRSPMSEYAFSSRLSKDGQGSKKCAIVPEELFNKVVKYYQEMCAMAEKIRDREL